MSTITILYRTASFALMLLGAIHNLVEWQQSRQETAPDLQEVEALMKKARVKVPGREVALYDFMKGFSYMMGYLFMGYGAIHWILASQALASPLAMAVNVLVCLIGLGVSFRYFFIVPTLFMGFSGGCYLAAWVLVAG